MPSTPMCHRTTKTGEPPVRLQDLRIKRRKGRECRRRASCLSSQSKWVASAALSDSRVKSRFLGFLEKLEGGPHVGLTLLQQPSAGPEGAIAPVHGASSPSGPVQGHLSLHGVTAALAENALFALLTVSSSSRTEAAGQRDPPCLRWGVLSWCTGGCQRRTAGPMAPRVGTQGAGAQWHPPTLPLPSPVTLWGLGEVRPGEGTTAKDQGRRGGHAGLAHSQALRGRARRRGGTQA